MQSTPLSKKKKELLTDTGVVWESVVLPETDMSWGECERCEHDVMLRKEVREKNKLESNVGGRLASLSQAFRQRRTSLRTRSKDDGKVLRKINKLMCVVRTMGGVGRCGRGSGWDVSQQLAESC